MISEIFGGIYNFPMNNDPTIFFGIVSFDELCGEYSLLTKFQGHLLLFPLGNSIPIDLVLLLFLINHLLMILWAWS